MLYADESIVLETEKMLKTFGPVRYIANLGHGIYPDMDRTKAKLFVETVKGYR